MIEERFASGTSPLHRRDARVKIVGALLFITVVAITKNFTVCGAALLASLLLLISSQLPLGPVLKRLAAANTFTLFLWLTLPFTYGGEHLLQLGPVALSDQGVRMAGLITLKTNIIVLALITLLSTSSIVNLGHGLETMKVPRRLTFLLLFSYRYVFVIYSEYLRLRRAAQLRCFVPGTNIHTYRTTGYLFGMTLVRSWNRSQRVYQAMQLRGFDGILHPLRTASVTSSDMAFLLLMIAVSASLAAMQFFV